jgi:hypothetical protein
MTRFEIPAFVMRMPRPRKPGLKLNGGVSTPHERAAVERRQASVLRAARGRASCTAGWTKRLSAFRFPFFLTRRHCERSEAIQFGAVAVLASETVPPCRAGLLRRFAPRNDVQDSGAGASRERMATLSAPAIAGEGDHAKHGGGGV